MVNENESKFCDFTPSAKSTLPESLFAGDNKVFDQLYMSARYCFMECLATCLSITEVGGKFIGDPMDIEMFKSTGWFLEEPECEDQGISTYVMPNHEDKKFDWSAPLDENKNYPYQLGIVKRFDFSSKLQRMSVIVKNLRTSQFYSFAKGSPESIKDLCVANSIPENFNEILRNYTQSGYRVLALARRTINISFQQAQKISRENIERKMTFLGFMVMENKIKKESAPAIQILSGANINSLMVTGDNPYTAICVARGCNIVPESAKVYLAEVVQKTKIKWTPIEKENALNSLQLNVAVEERKEEYIPRKVSEVDQVVVTEVHNYEEKVEENNEEIVSEDLPFDIAAEDVCLAFTGGAFQLLFREKDPECKLQETIKLLLLEIKRLSG